MTPATRGAATGAGSSPFQDADRMLEEVAGSVDRSDASRPISIRLPCPGTRPMDLIERVAAPDLFYWRDRDGCASAGIGGAALLTASGAGRFDEIRRGATALFQRLELHGDAPGSPVPRLFGGFAFREDEAAADVWSDFGDARFLLPEITCTASPAGGATWLTLSLPADRSAAMIEAALHRLGRLLQPVDPSRPGVNGPGPAVLTGDRGAGGGDGGESFRVLVEAALSRIRSGALEKVVVSRRRRLSLEVPADPARLIGRLDAAAGTFRFALRVGEALFLGASPERLVALSDGLLRTEAVAGTTGLREGGSAPLDARDKDLWEHELVVRAIVEALESVSTLEREDGPRVRTVGPVRHLATRFRGELRTGDHVLELVRRLHPTPAVGGAPTESAVAWIRENEPEPRGWYAGPIGWFDAGGDGEFAVALRCGVIRHRSLDLFAGSGVVVGSDADAEYEETGLKLTALPEALGLS